MNAKGNPKTLVASHPRNLNAVKSGAHSPRLIEARAAEIVGELGIIDELDSAGRIVLLEVARLTAIIEAIDRDLSDRGVSDRNGNERYLVQRRERFSRQLIEVTERLLEAQVRGQKKLLLDSPDEIVGEQSDYVRQLQAIALGRDPEARIGDRLAALKVLSGMGAKGTTSFFAPRVEPTNPDDPEYQAKVEKLEAELEEARKHGRLQQLRDQIEYAHYHG